MSHILLVSLGLPIGSVLHGQTHPGQRAQELVQHRAFRDTCPLAILRLADLGNIASEEAVPHRDKVEAGIVPLLLRLEQHTRELDILGQERLNTECYILES